MWILIEIINSYGTNNNKWANKNRRNTHTKRFVWVVMITRNWYDWTTINYWHWTCSMLIILYNSCRELGYVCWTLSLSFRLQLHIHTIAHTFGRAGKRRAHQCSTLMTIYIVCLCVCVCVEKMFTCMHAMRRMDLFFFFAFVFHCSRSYLLIHSVAHFIFHRLFSFHIPHSRTDKILHTNDRECFHSTSNLCVRAWFDD